MSTQHVVADALEEIGVIPTYKDAGLGGKFANAVTKRQEIKEKIETLEAEKGSLSQDIAFEMAKADMKVVTCGRWRVNFISDSTSSSLSKEKLLELGVGADIIAAATVTKAKDPYVQITAIGKGQVTRRENKAGVKNIRTARPKKIAKTKKTAA